MVMNEDFLLMILGSTTLIVIPFVMYMFDRDGEQLKKTLVVSFYGIAFLTVLYILTR